MFNLGFIGFGNMAEAITRGIRLNNKKIKILAYDISKKRLKDARKFNVVSAKTECEVANSCKIVILSVKPNDLSLVLETIKNDIAYEMNHNKNFSKISELREDRDRITKKYTQISNKLKSITHE